jgi:hypothetical protein
MTQDRVQAQDRCAGTRSHTLTAAGSHPVHAIRRIVRSFDWTLGLVVCLPTGRSPAAFDECLLISLPHVASRTESGGIGKPDMAALMHYVLREQANKRR